jgi:cytochrome c oxidase cbb3-type subunit 1
MSVSANTPAAPEAHEQTSRTPVLYLLGSGLCWLLVGLILSALASLKLHAPECLPFAWAGVGRLQAAASNVLLLGAASQTGLGIALWLLIHLGRTELACWGTAVIGTVVWNVALTAGVPALLLGGSTGIPSLELPASLAVILLVGYLLVAGNGIVAIAGCRRGGYAPSQWFILGAILWFGWLYTTAVVTTVVFPGRGVMTALSAGWFGQGVQWLWLTPLALAVLYYFIPELSGKTIRSPELAPVAFWSLALFGGWTAAAGLVGGPIPAWIVSVSVAAGVLLAIPVLLASANLNVGGSSSSPALKFAKLATWSFTLGGLAYAVTSLRCAKAVLHFTQFEVAVRELLQFGFVTGALFAGAYALVPRLAGRKLPNTALSNAHFGLSLLGLIIFVTAYAVGGWKQGWALADAKLELVSINAALKPWLRLHTAGLGVFLLGQFAFAANVVLLLVSFALPAGRTLVTEMTTGAAPAPAAK